MVIKAKEIKACASRRTLFSAMSVSLLPI